MFDLWTSHWGSPLVPAGSATPLIRSLLDTARCVAYACDVRASGAYMTAAQTPVASALAASPDGLPSSTLAERLGVTKQAVTGLVNRMEYAGLVLRIEHPLDGRCTLVQLTERGGRELVAVGRRLAAFNRGFEVRLGPERVAQLEEILRVITEDAAGVGLRSRGPGLAWVEGF